MSQCQAAVMKQWCPNPSSPSHRSPQLAVPQLLQLCGQRGSGCEGRVEDSEGGEASGVGQSPGERVGTGEEALSGGAGEKGRGRGCVEKKSKGGRTWDRGGMGEMEEEGAERAGEDKGIELREKRPREIIRGERDR